MNSLFRTGAIARRRPPGASMIIPILMLCAIGSPPRPAAASPLIGINLTWVNDYNNENMFADAIKQARNITDLNGNDLTYTTSVDSNGWPKVDCRVTPFAGVVLNGAYALSFNGQASIDLHGGGTLTNQVYNSSTNTTTATITQGTSNSMQLFMSNTIRVFGGATNTGFTNMKLMRPISPGSTTSYSTSTVFTTQLQNLVAKFNVIRFKDYLATDGNASVNWSDRLPPTYFSCVEQRSGYGGPGVGGPLEYAVAFANQVNKDIWINVPLNATDDYVTKMAQTILYGTDGNLPYTSTQASPVWAPLNSNLKVYIEYSNELWNSGFPFPYWANYALAQSDVAGGAPLNWDGDANNADWAARRTARRTVQISSDFRAVVGDSAMMSRFRPVLENQEGNSFSWSQQQAHMLEDYYNNSATVTTPHPPAYYIYGGGGAAYYNPDNSSTATWDINSIWTSQTFDVPTFTSALQDNSNYSTALFGQTIAYEGGPSMNSCSCSFDTLKQQAWSDPRMTTLVTAHQTAWNQSGAGLLIYFEDVFDYQWGFTTDVTVLNTAKLAAVDQINTSAQAAGTFGSAIPATIPVSPFALPWTSSGVNPANMVASGSWTWLGYIVNNTASGVFNIGLSAGSSGTTNQADIYLDGALVGTITVPNTGSNTTYTATATVATPNLAVGSHGLIIKAKAVHFGVNSIVVTGGGSPPIPPAPTGLALIPSSGQLTLNWTSALGATTYKVYRGTTAGGESGTAIATGVIPATYTNTGLTNGTTYYYKVSAVNITGESAKSSEASGAPIDNTAHVVQTSTAPVIDGTVDSVWSSAPSYTLGNVTSGSTTDTGTFQMLWDSTNLYVLATVHDSTLVEDTTSVWNGDTVEVYIDGTNSKQTTYGPNDFQYAFQYNNATATESKHSPGSLTGVVFAQGNFSGGYRMEIKIPWSTIGVTPSANNLIGTDVMVDDCVTSGSRACKRAWWATVDNTWNDPALMGTGRLVPAGGSAPSAPAGLTATPGNAQVALSWTASSGATSYNVLRSTVSGSGYASVATGISVTNYTNTGLTNGTTYYFVVTATNSFGTSGNSNQASATPSAGTSGLVKINTGGPAVSPFVADADFSGGTVATNWTGTIDTSAVTSPAPQAVYQSERYGSPLTYTVGGLTANASYTVRLHFCENYWSATGQRKFTVAINSTNVLTNFDIFATTGAQHKANIQQFTAAANSSGQIVIAFTNVVDHALINGIEINALAAPAPPAGLTATPGNAQVALSWTASSGATSYNVLRSTVSGSGYASVATGIATTSYTNTGLTNGTAYYFVVTATNSGGTSGNSNQASATPTSGNTHSGSWAAKCVFSGTPTFKNMTEVPNVVSNSSYSASFWFKGTGSVTLRIFAGSWGTLLSTTSFTATSSWQQFSASFSTGANTQITYNIEDSSSVAGTAYIDDCFMGMLNGTNVLTNPGFESGNTAWGIDTGAPFSIVQNP